MIFTANGLGFIYAYVFLTTNITESKNTEGHKGLFGVKVLE
jgi:hypothetical protein